MSRSWAAGSRASAPVSLSSLRDQVLDFVLELDGARLPRSESGLAQVEPPLPIVGRRLLLARDVRNGSIGRVAPDAEPRPRGVTDGALKDQLACGGFFITDTAPSVLVMTVPLQLRGLRSISHRCPPGDETWVAGIWDDCYLRNEDMQNGHVRNRFVPNTSQPRAKGTRSSAAGRATPTASSPGPLPATQVCRRRAAGRSFWATRPDRAQTRSATLTSQSVFTVSRDALSHPLVSGVAASQRWQSMGHT